MLPAVRSVPSFAQRKKDSISVWQKRESNALIMENDKLLENDKLPPNDDRAEKLVLNLERLRCSYAEKNKLSPMVEIQLEKEKSPIKSVISGFTDEERDEHFDFCMKLSSENKITTKNAFGLHLIDYFADVVNKHEGVPNFQMASMTLHASARIYSFRVDCLHSEALKMASGLHSKIVARETAKDDVPGAEDDEAQKLKNKNKRRGLKKFLQPGNEKSLDIVIETIEEPHEKFYLIKSIFDGTKCGLLYELPILNDSTSHIPLADACLYFQNKQPFVHGENLFVIDSSIKDMIEPIVDLDLPIVPALDLFNFAVTKWPLSAESDTILESTEEYDDIVNELVEAFDAKCFIMETADMDKISEEAFVKTFEDVCKLGEPVKTPCLEDLAFSPLDVASGHSSGEKRSLRHTLSRSSKKRRSKFSFADPYTMDLAGSVIKSFRNSAMEPPTPRPPGTVDQIIGPLFKHTVDPIIDAAMTGRKLKKPKPTYLPKRKQERKYRISWEEKGNKVELKTMRSKKKSCFAINLVLKNWLFHDKILPEISLSKKDFRTLQLIGVEPSFLYRNDYFERLSILEGSIDDDISHLPCPSEGDIYEDEPYKADLEMTSVKLMGNLSLGDEDLVPKPEMVKPDFVHYAKHAKNINQKRLKSTIWSIVSKFYYSKNKLFEKNEDERGTNSIFLKNGIMGKCLTIDLSFVTLYGLLQKSLPAQLKEKLTIPIAFVSLLHLANEKNLNIENSAGNMSNLVIRIDSGQSKSSRC